MTAKRCRLWLTALALTTVAVPAAAQQLDAHFSCGQQREQDGLPTEYADSGAIRVDGAKIVDFYWESSLFRSTHGLECSIDQGDGLQAEVTGDASWRITLQDAKAARAKRGYDYSHGFNCTIRVERVGDSVHINPSCPALCGSRPNFTELSFDLKSGDCHYED